MADAPESPEIFFSKALFGPLLDDEETAREFATLILRRLHGEAELAKQHPLVVTDEGADWLVKGSYQESGKPVGAGVWFIRVRKSDCRVQKFGHYEPLELPKEVQEVIEQEKKKISE